MKGVIAKCLGELVETRFGHDKWAAALEKAGLDPKTRFLPVADVDDEAVLKVVDSVCQVLGLTLAQAADAFGEYWVCTFAPKLYAPYYRGVESAKDFLLKLDRIHEASTRTIPNAHPPRFDYEWKGDHTLIITYRSERHLMDFMLGLTKAVGKYFNEDLKVTRLGRDRVEVVFAG